MTAEQFNRLKEKIMDKYDPDEFVDFLIAEGLMDMEDLVDYLGEVIEENSEVFDDNWESE